MYFHEGKEQPATANYAMSKIGLGVAHFQWRQIGKPSSALRRPRSRVTLPASR